MSESYPFAESELQGKLVFTYVKIFFVCDVTSYKGKFITQPFPRVVRTRFTHLTPIIAELFYCGWGNILEFAMMFTTVRIKKLFSVPKVGWASRHRVEFQELEVSPHRGAGPVEPAISAEYTRPALSVRWLQHWLPPQGAFNKGLHPFSHSPYPAFLSGWVDYWSLNLALEPIPILSKPFHVRINMSTFYIQGHLL